VIGMLMKLAESNEAIDLIVIISIVVSISTTTTADNINITVGSRAASFKRPLLSVDMSVCMYCMCVSKNKRN